MKPIDPGCFCMIKNSVAGNNGKGVTAISFVGECLFMSRINSDYWRIDREIPVVDLLGRPDGTTTFVRECDLERLDGEDFSHEKHEEQELVK